MRKKFIASLALSAAMIMSAMAPVYAEFPKSTIKVENELGTADIRVSIEEQYKDGTEYDTETPRQVRPGDNVDKVVYVFNDAEDAYVRVFVAFKSDYSEIAMDESALDIEDDWVYYGGYWYNKTPVKRGDKVKFMNGFSVPNTFGNEVSGKTFGLEITTEAVQSAHFTPDWDDELDPWRGTIIEECSHTSEYDMGEAKDESVFTIDYRGGSEGLIKLINGAEGEDNFFRDWMKFMPGDTFEGHFNVTNKFYEPVTIYFHTETPEVEDNPDFYKLLSACSLEIINDETGDYLFNGPMSTVIDHPIAIGKFIIDTDTNFTFRVSVPDYMRNEYSLLDTKTIWVFETAYGDEFELPETGSHSNTGAGMLFIGTLFTAFILLGKEAFGHEN